MSVVGPGAVKVFSVPPVRFGASQDSFSFPSSFAFHSVWSHWNSLALFHIAMVAIPFGYAKPLGMSGLSKNVTGSG